MVLILPVMLLSLILIGSSSMLTDFASAGNDAYLIRIDSPLDDASDWASDASLIPIGYSIAKEWF
jgi:hypothetical protein